MTNYKKYLAGIVAILFLLLFTKQTSKEEEGCPKPSQKIFMIPKYRALVIEKCMKRDNNSHLIPSLDMNNGGEILDFNIHILDNNQIRYINWENIQAGDSIFKNRGSLDILVKKPWGDTVFIPFECPPSRSR